MTDYQAILDEEFEVLDSIFPDELEKVDERTVRIRVEPEEPSTSHPLTLNLVFHYPSTYPDVIPDLSFEPLDEESGELSPEEAETLLGSLRTTGEESLGMAMTFTIASTAREGLLGVILDREKREKEEDDRRAAAYEEAEAARTRGTPVTPVSFDKWRKNFVLDLKARREKDEEDRVKALPTKEREEYRRRRDRPSGKQLFESSAALLTSDENLYEEGTNEVDLALYSREQRERERRQEEEEEERAREGIVGDGNESD